MITNFRIIRIAVSRRHTKSKGRGPRQAFKGTVLGPRKILSKPVRITGTVQGPPGFNRDRTGTVDRDRGKTCGKNRDRRIRKEGFKLINPPLRIRRSLFFPQASPRSLSTVPVRSLLEPSSPCMVPVILAGSGDDSPFFLDSLC